ncbi:MAG: DUF4907 domain-containing protein [Crocinitomicaceae bacterium]
MKLLSVFVLVILFGACTENENQVKDLRDLDTEIDDKDIQDDPPVEVEEVITDTIPNESTETKTNSDWSYKVTSISENNWGYQIFQQGKMIINQTSIPSVQGIDGFDSEEKAERTAQFILNKVENGTFPPTVKKEDLEKLDVLRD